MREALKWWLSGLPWGIVIGGLIGLIRSVAGAGGGLFRNLIGGIIIGVCCQTIVGFLYMFFQEPIEKLSRGLGWAARAAIYTVGGALGFFVGLVLALRLVWRLPFDVIFAAVDFAGPMLLAAAVGLTLGVAFYSYHQVKHRLEVSIARLKEHEFAEKELELARSVQSRLMPPQESEGEGFRIAARNLAARYVAGDFYDIFPLADGSVGIAVADVSGKGMAASLIMATVKATLPLLAGAKAVDQTLTELNAKLVRELAKREFVAIALAKFEASTGRLQVANAGLPDPYLLRRSSPPAPVSPPGPRLPLGIRSAVAYQSSEIQLQKGDRLLMFSDGLPEAPVGPGEQLGYDALISLISVNGEQDPGEFLDGLFATVRARTSEQLEDDWTALVLERT